MISPCVLIIIIIGTVSFSMRAASTRAAHVRKFGGDGCATGQPTAASWPRRTAAGRRRTTGAVRRPRRRGPPAADARSRRRSSPPRARRPSRSRRRGRRRGRVDTSPRPTSGSAAAATRRSTPADKHDTIRSAHTRLPSVGFGTDPGSWQSACK